jgi:uncharacterized protein YkwD
MNMVDILLICVVLLSVFNGWRKGFMLGLIDLVILAGSVVTAFFLYPYLGGLLHDHLPALGVWTSPLSFLLVYILARLLLTFIMNQILKATTHESHASPTNRMLGIIPGFANGLIWATVIAALLLSVPVWDKLTASTRNSRLVNTFTVPAEWLEAKLSPVFDEAVKKTLNKVTVEPDSNGFVRLPYTTTEFIVREDLEAKMLQLINEERSKEGLQPLKADYELTKVSRAHSKEMFERGYFSHVTPEGKGPFDRMRTAHIVFKNAGENLALAPTLSIAHNGLMNSPGHRANILRPQFGRVGIGVLDSYKYGLMITQSFRNP